MNKKKKGFTLIELLAIIVILAIVAVITVPIILNVIDNSRKGAAKDSTYGYKDAINKYYLAKSLDNTDYDIPDGEYSIDPQTGYLVGTETLQIQVSGQAPTGGTVQIIDNEPVLGCLQFNEYKIMISDGNIGEATKGTCGILTIAAQTIIDKSITESELAEYSDKSTVKVPVVINHPEITKTNIATLTGNNEITDTATGSTISALTSYTYMGSDPYNYIYFNCDTYAISEQNNDTCEMWRIISVENNKLKITTADAIGRMPWDDGSNHNGTAINDWATSGLNGFLNGSYLNNGTSISYKDNKKEINVPMKNYLSNYIISASGSGSGSGSGSMLGKRNSYLNSISSKMISSTTWYLGAVPSNDEFTSQQFYVYERGNLKANNGDLTGKTSIDSKVAIITPSDYLFSSSICYNSSANSYWENYSCVTSNWLNNGYNQWTLSHILNDEYISNWVYRVSPIALDGQYVQGNGLPDGNSGLYYEPYGVRPVVYLKSNILIEGTGTSSDPYKIIG